MNKYKKLSLGKDVNGQRIFKDEHRHIMENYLGRKLNRYEVVHHINGNKNDNRIENLQVMTLQEHSSLHRKGVPLSKKTREKIGIKHYRKPSSIRQKNKEQILEIAKKYKEWGSYRKVDRYFGFANGTTGSIIRGDFYYDYQEDIKKILDK